MKLREVSRNRPTHMETWYRTETFIWRKVGQFKRNIGQQIVLQQVNTYMPKRKKKQKTSTHILYLI